MGNEPIKVVVVGGGVAALEAALALEDIAGELVDVELVAPEPVFHYRPLAVARPFELDDVQHYDLAALAAKAGASLTLGTVSAVDPTERRVETAAGAVIEYDVLLVACGAVPAVGVDGAITFRGPADMESLEDLLAGPPRDVARIIFAIPQGAVWSLPAYELALLTASALEAQGRGDIDLLITTPEAKPLAVFGAEAADATADMLERHGIAVRVRSAARSFDGTQLVLSSGEALQADRVVAIPRLEGPRLTGLPHARDGFIPVDAHGRVAGLDDVFAAGDVTTFAVKHGGIAAQQADAAAQAIAELAGADIVPQPFRPVLRGMLLTGARPQFMRRDLVHSDVPPVVSLDELWWPPAKIAGRYLGPLILSLDDGGATELVAEAVPGVAVDVTFDSGAPHGAEADAGGLLVVAPEDTLGEVAERMRDSDVGSAVVAEHGHTVGILTSRDMLNAFASRVHPSEARVRHWMTEHPVTIGAGATPAEAMDMMASRGLHHLPVVDEEGRPVAMLRLRDLVGAGTAA